MPSPWSHGARRAPAADGAGIAPTGDFAESFAAWQVPGGAFGSALGPPYDGAQRALLAEPTAP